MNAQELKARAYDLLKERDRLVSQLEVYTQELSAIEAELAQPAEQPQE